MGKYEAFGLAVDRCESPIERMFLAALLFLGDTTFVPVAPSETCIIARDVTGVLLYQQLRIDGHRVDFALSRPGISLRFVVELDGHTFHGKTPEQFERDSARQRAITSRGWTVLRFAGREIVRDPRRCALEAMAEAARMVDLAGAKAGAVSQDPAHVRAPSSSDPETVKACAAVAEAEARGDWAEITRLLVKESERVRRRLVG